MRIIAGAMRGRPLRSPSGLETRPTSDRVRETLFSMLVSRLGSFDGLRIADLFAGTGAYGLEALSRGAAHATFVELDSEAAAVIRANAGDLGVSEKVRVLCNSALSLQKSEPFDLIFADPPYGPNSGTAAARAVADADWLAPSGWMAVETERGEKVEANGWKEEAERDIGRARLTLFRRP